MTIKNKCQIFLTAILIITFIAGAILWSIAREEIYYLCGNFSSGVEKSSVIRQLNTANLSSYNQSITKSGSMIIFSSKINFEIYQCTIELNETNKVVRATYTSKLRTSINAPIEDIPDSGN